MRPCHCSGSGFCIFRPVTGLPSPALRARVPRGPFFLRSGAPPCVRRNWPPREQLRPVLLFRSGPDGCGLRAARFFRASSRPRRSRSERREGEDHDLPDELRPTPGPDDQGTQRNVQNGAQSDYLDAPLHSRTRRSRRCDAPDRQNHRIQRCADARLHPGTPPDQAAKTGALSPGTWPHRGPNRLLTQLRSRVPSVMLAESLG